MVIPPNIPILDDLDAVSIALAVKRLTGTGPSTYKAYALVASFVRLVDLAVEEYERGRELISEYWDWKDSFRVSAMVRSCSHYEVCLAALRRAVRFHRHFCGNSDITQCAGDALTRIPDHLPEDAHTCIISLRNAVEHLDERVIKGEIYEGRLFALAAKEDELVLGDHHLAYKDLATWLRLWHAHAKLVVAVDWTRSRGASRPD